MDTNVDRSWHIFIFSMGYSYQFSSLEKVVVRGIHNMNDMGTVRLRPSHCGIIFGLDAQLFHRLLYPYQNISRLVQPVRK